MKIAVLKERAPFEARAAVSADAVKKLTALGAEVCVERGAGLGSGIRDEALVEAGATLVPTASDACNGAQVVLKVQRPQMAGEGQDDELALIPSGAALIGLLAPYDQPQRVAEYATRQITTFAMEFIPRISRAQSMDALSSQANLAGYRAVIEGFSELAKAAPMLMTAAGTVPPARVLVLGAGVAGLQAIATAKRLGAVVSAFDVRAAAREQVESLGGKFIEVPAEESGEGQGGYAKEMSEDYKRKQQALIRETLKTQDLVISTALIPGKPAPVLIPADAVPEMKEGAVIVDLAVASGGNCPLSERDRVAVHHGVKLVGHTNLPSKVAADATPLYARNLVNFLGLLIKDKDFAPDWDDEIVKAALLTRDGVVVHEGIKGMVG